MFHTAPAVPADEARTILEGALLTVFVNHLLFFEGPALNAIGACGPNAIGGYGSVDVVAILTPTTPHVASLLQRHRDEMDYAVVFDDDNRGRSHESEVR
jgi:hypothetical protein